MTEQTPPRMLLYQGSTRMKVVGASGIGQAVRQQANVLARIGIEVVTDPREPHEAAQFNVPLPNSYLAARKARAAGKKVVWVAHSTEADIRGSFLLSGVAAPALRRFYHRCYETADLVLTPTDYSRRLWLGYGLKAPIEAISNGVDTRFFSPDAAGRARFRRARGIAEDARVVIGVGHYVRRKGIIDFVQAARQVPEAEFWWFGHTDLHLVSADVRNAVINAPSNCHFPGFVSRDELADAYRGADLFLFPTHEETEGIALLEALACGIPVLVRDIPIYETWLTDGGDVVKFRTERELVDGVRSLLEGDNAELTAAGRGLALRHDFAEVAAQLARIYAQYGIVD